MQIITRSLLSYLSLLSACGAPTTGERWVLVEIPSWPTRIDTVSIESSYGDIAGQSYELTAGTPGFAFSLPAGPPASLDLTARVNVDHRCEVASTRLTRSISDDTRFPVIEKLSLPAPPSPTFPSRQNQSLKPFRIRCNSWLPLSSEQPEAFSTTGIWGLNDSNIWISGYRHASNPLVTDAVIYRWNGATTQLAFENSQIDRTAFLSIWGSNTGEVWTKNDRGDIFKWDGMQWSKWDQFPYPGPVHAAWGSSESDMWVATLSAIYHRDSQSWRQITGWPDKVGAVYPYAIFQGLDSQHFWVSSFLSSNGRRQDYLMFWNGVSWQWQCGREIFWFGRAAFSAASDGSAWISQGSSLGQWDGISWRHWGFIPNLSVNAIFVFDENNAIAVGYDTRRIANTGPTVGKTVVWNGVTWSEDFAESAPSLTALWASDPEHIYATDTKARLLRCVNVAR